MAIKRRRLPMTNANPALIDLIPSFRLFNRTTGKSPHTVEWYDTRLRLFARFAGPDATLADLTIDRVRGYVVHLQERNDRHANNPFMRSPSGPLSSAYIQGAVRALRAFASWLQADGYTETNILRPLKPPKIQHKIAQVLTDEEIRNLVVSFDLGDAFGVRNHTVVLTLLDCGLRASELCGLEVGDVHLRQRYLKVLGKGNKERLVPFGAGTQTALMRWCEQARPVFDPSDNRSLFLNANGAQLTLNGLERIIKRAGVRAGVPRLHCHLLRHTFATTYLVREVGDPLRLQQLLGHTSLEMVRHYVALANIQESLLDRRASPMDLVIDSPAHPNGRRLQPSRSTHRNESEKEGGRASPRYYTALSRGRSGR